MATRAAQQGEEMVRRKLCPHRLVGRRTVRERKKTPVYWKKQKVDGLSSRDVAVADVAP